MMNDRVILFQRNRLLWQRPASMHVHYIEQYFFSSFFFVLLLSLLCSRPFFFNKRSCQISQDPHFLDFLSLSIRYGSFYPHAFVQHTHLPLSRRLFDVAIRNVSKLNENTLIGFCPIIMLCLFAVNVVVAKLDWMSIVLVTASSADVRTERHADERMNECTNDERNGNRSTRG